ncbi:MAG: flagellin [Candidatus Eremiobacteraeota bacterium]|nr:flagellin [Candidatus Eremiobacteraeota bacterium]
MDVLSLAGGALNASLKTQNELQSLTKRLSSGLRVNSATDDPSGLAIAESLASKVSGLDEGSRQIQTANNALTVAEGAMATIGDILQRMRSLVVQARSDLQSTADHGNIQAELSQLRLEIDRIAQNTSFNGRALLDGSASSAGSLPTRAMLVVNPNASGGGQLIDISVDPSMPAVAPNSPQLVQSLTVDSYDPVANALNLTVTIGSQQAQFGPNQTSPVQIGNGTNFQPGFFPPTPGSPTFYQYDQYGNYVMSFNVGTLTPADVGKSAIVVTLPAQSKAPGSALLVNTGDGEGAVVSVDIPGMSSTNLGVNQMILGDDLQNQGAEYRLDYAIQTLGASRAVVGAQMVSLQEAAQNANTTSVNTQASESAIRDLNVGAAMVDFTRAQVLRQFQTRIIADSDKMSQSVATLVSDSIVH